MIHELHIVTPATGDDYVARRLRRLVRLLRDAGADTQSHAGLLGGEDGYGCTFKNDVFEMRPYWWGNCECGGVERDGVCAPTCPSELPNFKCGDLEIRWYKYVGRSQEIRASQDHNLIALFNSCEDSIARRSP